MGNNRVRITAIALTAIAILGCTTTEPVLQSDVDVARSVWVANHPQTYSFDVQTATSWFPPDGYYRIQVSNGEIVAATDPTGAPVTDLARMLTLDTIWDRLLSARASGQLNSATFDERGVPVESDMGPWPSDGGLHYSVRNFTRVETFTRGN